MNAETKFVQYMKWKRRRQKSCNAESLFAMAYDMGISDDDAEKMILEIFSDEYGEVELAKKTYRNTVQGFMELDKKIVVPNISTAKLRREIATNHLQARIEVGKEEIHTEHHQSVKDQFISGVDYEIFWSSLLEHNKKLLEERKKNEM